MFNEKSQQEKELITIFNKEQMKSAKESIYEIAKRTNKHENTVMEWVIDLTKLILPEDMQNGLRKEFYKFK